MTDTTTDSKRPEDEDVTTEDARVEAEEATQAETQEAEQDAVEQAAEDEKPEEQEEGSEASESDEEAADDEAEGEDGDGSEEADEPEVTESEEAEAEAEAEAAEGEEACAGEPEEAEVEDDGASEPEKPAEPEDDAEEAETDAAPEEPEESEDDGESEGLGADAAGEASEEVDADGAVAADAADAQAETDENVTKEAPEKRHVLKVVLIILGIIVVLAGIAIGVLAYDDSQRIKEVPQTTVLDGKIDVSGMTAEELSKTVTTRVENGFTTKVELSAGGKDYTIDLAEVGTLNAQQTVDQAFAPYDVPFYERYLDRIMTLIGGKRNSYEVTTAITPDKEKLTAQIEEIAEKKVNRDAEDAGYKYSNGKLVTVKAKDGLKMDVDATVEAVTKALEGETTHVTAHVDATIEKTKAENTKPGKAIFVNLSSCMLYLYDNGKVTFKTPCTPGQSGYATPSGDWTLSAKIANPTWTNPGSEWASNMPDTIGPGRSNPMGLRKMAVSCGGGIYIHGTDNTGALGSPGSHGCVRVSNDEIVKLFDMVEVGIPIIIR